MCFYMDKKLLEKKEMLLKKYGQQGKGNFSQYRYNYFKCVNVLLIKKWNNSFTINHFFLFEVLSQNCKHFPLYLETHLYTSLNNSKHSQFFFKF